MNSTNRNIFQLYMIRCGSERNRNRIQRALEKAGVFSKVYFEPIHLTPFYKSLGYGKDNLPITERVSGDILSLPMCPDISHKEMDYIVKIVNQ